MNSLTLFSAYPDLLLDPYSGPNISTGNLLFRGPFFKKKNDYLFIHFEPVSQISPDGLELSGYPVMTLDSPQQSFFLRLPWAGIVGITSKHNWVSYLFVGVFMFMALCPWFLPHL